MSLFDFATVWQTSRASGNNLLVHLALAEVAVDGEAQVSMTQLGNLARCSHDTAARAIEYLISIKAVKVTGDNNGPRAARYTLVYDHTQIADLLQTAESKGQQNPQVAYIRADPVPTPMPITPPQDTQVAYIKPPTIPPAVVELQVKTLDDIRVATGIKSVDHAANLQELLAALQVEKSDNLPFYWFRAEHTEDYKALLQEGQWTLNDLLIAIKDHRITLPDMRRIGDLRAALVAVRVLHP